MSFAGAVKLLLTFSIFLTVFALALRAHAADLVYLLREWRLGLRAMAVMFVIVPTVALLVTGLFDLKPSVEIALVALAFSPVPPLLPGKQMKAGGSATYVTSLLVLASLLSILITPLGMFWAGRMASLDVHVAPAAIVRIVLVSIVLPLAVGLIAGRLLGSRAARLSTLVGRIANVLLLGGVLVLLVVMLPAIGRVIGDGTIVALVAMIIAGLVAGHWGAGADPANKAALALAAATRHPGIAVAIATTSFPDEKLAPAAIILFALLSALISIPYLRRLHRGSGAGA
jgi:BASS family bile acid:Na+ symporter